MSVRMNGKLQGETVLTERTLSGFMPVWARCAKRPKTVRAVRNATDLSRRCGRNDEPGRFVRRRCPPGMPAAFACALNCDNALAPNNLHLRVILGRRRTPQAYPKGTCAVRKAPPASPLGLNQCHWRVARNQPIVLPSPRNVIPGHSIR